MGKNMFMKNLSINNIIWFFQDKKAIAASLILATTPIVLSLILGAPPLLEYSESEYETVMAYLCTLTATYPDAVCRLILPRGFWTPLLYNAGETGSSAPMNPKWITLKRWKTYYYFIWFFLVWQLTLSPIFRFGSWALGRLIRKKAIVADSETK